MAKTVRVRIAVVIAENGAWAAYGWSNAKGVQAKDGEMRQSVVDCLDPDVPDSYAIHFVEADVPVHEPTTVPGQVAS